MERKHTHFFNSFVPICCPLTVLAVVLGLTFTSNLCFAEDEKAEKEEVVFEVDAEIEETSNIAYELNNLDYCANEDFSETKEDIAITAETELIPTSKGYNRGNSDIRIKALCKKLNEVRELESQLSDNTSALEDNARAMKDKEQSIENRALGAIGAGTVGIGGMMAASALSEQKADDEAAEDMAAYLATFRCTYAGGKSVKGGTEPIELPGGNDKTLMQLRNEYVTLAASLKERKESLGMKPGIESEEILDKAEMGLYDDENVGITKGHYASLYRAQTGNAEDQAKIDAEKSKSEKRVKGGAIAAGIGVVGGIAGNALINGGSGKGGGLMDKVKDLVGDDESGDLLGKLKDSFGDDSEGLLDKVKGIVGDDKMSDIMKNLDISKLKDLSGGDLDNIDIESLKGSLGDKASILDGLGQ